MQLLLPMLLLALSRQAPVLASRLSGIDKPCMVLHGLQGSAECMALAVHALSSLTPLKNASPALMPVCCRTSQAQAEAHGDHQAALAALEAGLMTQLDDRGQDLSHAQAEVQKLMRQLDELACVGSESVQLRGCNADLER